LRHSLAQAFSKPIANGGAWGFLNMHLQAGMFNGWRVEFHFEMWGVGDKIYKEPVRKDSCNLNPAKIRAGIQYIT